MEKGFVARCSIDINAPQARVWQALTDPDTIRKYMFGTTVSSEWKVGSPITFSGEWKGNPYRDHGVILRFEPGHALSYSHFSPLTGLPDIPENYHTVTVELSTKGSGTHVLLTQDNEPTEDGRNHSEANWKMMLEGLKKLLES